MQLVHQVPKNRGKKHDFSPFTDSQLLSAYNAVSTREMRFFSDRQTLERRLVQLLDSRELILDWYSDGSQEMVTEDGVAIYSLRNHHGNRKALGHSSEYESLVITVLVDGNPKTGKSMYRFALYESGITIAEYANRCEALSGREGRLTAKTDIRYDLARGYISLTHPETGETVSTVEHYDNFWLDTVRLATRFSARKKYEQGEGPRPSYMDAERVADEIKAASRELP